MVKVCAGFVITPEVQIVIASQAALLLLNMEHDYYSRVPTILVYPSPFTTARPERVDRRRFRSR